MDNAGILDELAPMFVGSEALTLTLSDPSSTRRAFNSISVLVDYTGAGDDGVRLPMELLITGPSPSSFRRHNYRRTAPPSFAFTPIEGGRHMVVLREIGHNRLLGKLEIVVEGDPLE
jgi:hypothetical protein